MYRAIDQNETNHPRMLLLVLLLCMIALQGFTWAATNPQQAGYYAILRSGVADALKKRVVTPLGPGVETGADNATLAANTYTGLDLGQVISVIEDKTLQLKSLSPASSKDLDLVAAWMESMVLKNFRTVFPKDGPTMTKEEVESRLTQVFDGENPNGDPTTAGLRTSPLSDYRFLLGGSWVHTQDEVAAGKFTAEMFVRTRPYDGRGGKIGAEHPTLATALDQENTFLDLMVDAQFLTNQAFNQTDSNSVVSTGKGPGLLLTSARSSKLNMGLFLGMHHLGFVDFFDNGAFGPTFHFELSSQEGSADVFRRAIVGIRLENRSVLALNGASMEVGFTVNKTPGSLDQDRTLFGVQRAMLDMALPLTNEETRLGMYVQFHGEWPLAANDDQDMKARSAGVSGNTTPPVYQFRLGATFDPANIFGVYFGGGKK